VIALPGPSSVLTALSVAALPTDRFFFEGFLPSKQNARRTQIAELARIDATLVMFESGARVQDSLQDLAGIMGERDAAICREMTKLHEEVRRATRRACRHIRHARNPRRIRAGGGPPAADAGMDDAALDDLLRTALTHSTVKDAVAQAVDASGRAKREVYARALELSKETRSGDDD
jgi:16S rRNA (cytidine1402-2'-O)-methyltransferase